MVVIQNSSQGKILKIKTVVDQNLKPASLKLLMIINDSFC